MKTFTHYKKLWNQLPLAIAVVLILLAGSSFGQMQHSCYSHYTFGIVPTQDSLHFNGPANPAGTTFAWDFGDGTTSTQHSPTHAYSPGTYLVCLVVTLVDSASGNILCTSHYCDSLHVPVPTWNCNAHFAIHHAWSNDTAYFVPAPNFPGTTYSWDFGDGSTSTDFAPRHLYAAGNYLACLTVTLNSATGAVLCTDTHCDSVHAVAPHYNCHAHYTHFFNQPGDSVRFYAPMNSTGTTYAWDFGDGSTSTSQNPTHGYTPGVYWACLTVTLTDSNGTVLCTDNHCDSIHVFAPHYNCNAHYFAHQFMGTDSVHFSGAQNTLGTAYAWDFGDGGTSSMQNPNHIYAQTGTYYTCLTVTLTSAAGAVLCTDTHCDSVRVNPPPPPIPCNAHFMHFSRFGGLVFLAPPNEHNAYYSWDFGDGTTGNHRFAMHHYAQPGVYYVCLTVTDTASNGTICSDTWCDSVRTFSHHGHCPHWISTLPDAGSIEEFDRLAAQYGGTDLNGEVYPNPVTDATVLHLQDTNGDVMFRVFDSTGRLIVSMNNLGDGDYDLNRSNFVSGLYFFQVMDASGIINDGKLIVQ